MGYRHGLVENTLLNYNLDSELDWRVESMTVYRTGASGSGEKAGE